MLSVDVDAASPLNTLLVVRASIMSDTSIKSGNREPIERALTWPFFYTFFGQRVQKCIPISQAEKLRQRQVDPKLLIR